MHQDSAVSLSENKRMAATPKSCQRAQTQNNRACGARIVTMAPWCLSTMTSPRLSQRTFPRGMALDDCQLLAAPREEQFPVGRAQLSSSKHLETAGKTL